MDDQVAVVEGEVVEGKEGGEEGSGRGSRRSRRGEWNEGGSD